MSRFSYACGLGLALFVALAPRATHAYTVNTTGGHEIKWSVPSESVLINSSSGPTGAVTAIQAALSTWSTVPWANFQFIYAGTTTVSGAVWDGYNVCSFGNLGTGGVIARNTYWSYPDTGQMIESDIVFNTYYIWSVSGEAGKIDLQNTATHELGHALSLADLYGGGDAEKTMYGYITYGETKKRTLDADDIAGLIHLYPAPTNTLTVISAHGGAYPGTVTTNWGAALSQWVTNSPVSVGVSTQYMCIAGTVASNAYTQVATTNVTLTLTNNATLTWQWQTQYRLAAQTNGNGSVTAADGWYASGSNAVLTASPAVNWHFARWSGDTNGCAIVGNVVTAAMTQARTLVAAFEIDQKTLTVISAHGGVYPGTVTTNWGTVLSQWVTNSPVALGVSTQFVCMAGTVASNFYTQMAVTNVTLTLTNNATLTWQWQTQYRLAAQTNGNGSVTAADGWYASGSNAVLTASPAVNWHFARWSGDTNGCAIVGNVVTAAMTQARTLVAAFEIDQKTLTVVSARGGTYPGTVTTNWGTVLSQWVTNSPLALGVSTQFVCMAGTVTSNFYTQVAVTNVMLTLTNNATLTWQWQTQYRLAAQTNGNGSVTAADGWYAAGSNAVLTASAGAYWHFARWSGGTSGCAVAGNVITAAMTQARSVVANFDENLAPLGTPEPWLVRYALTNDTAASEELKDTDGDGMLAWQEYVADTDPTNSASVLLLTGVTFDAGTVRVDWKGGQWAKQYIDVRTDLAATNSFWTCVMTNDVLPTLTTNFMIQAGITNPVLFYRVRVTR